MKEFKYTSGTVIGKSHRDKNMNNQDAHAIYSSDKITAGIICDGCGSEPHSEVGAVLASKFILSSLVDNVSLDDPLEILSNIENDLLSKIHSIADASDAFEYKQYVYDHFLFTIMGFLITKKRTYIFSFGDGMYALNDEVHRIGPFLYNAPPYIAYNLFNSDERFVLQEDVKTSTVKNLFIGSDGMCDYLDLGIVIIPKNKKELSPVSHFWNNEKYFANNCLVNNYLRLVNWPTKDSHGLLSDDTTLISVRKKKGGKSFANIFGKKED